MEAYTSAIKRLWKDSCTVYVRKPRTNPENMRTEFFEEILHESLPCKLSFVRLAAAEPDGHAARIAQGVKLFIDTGVEIPAGCRIDVIRKGEVFRYKQSRQAGVLYSHQEIPLEAWERWA